MAATLLLPKQPELPPVNLRFEPFGAARRLFEYQGPEVVVSGPAGTGKSVGCLYKLHFLASRVPGFRALIVRKTRVSLTESGLVTFELKVLPPRHPALSGPSRAMRQSYRYPNGAEIVVGGMDKASKIMSTEFDCVYVQEAIELTENDWESLTTRLRNGKLAYQQLLADTNPDSPRHWLKRRCDAGRCLLLESRHEDNPSLWDRAAGRWTPAGVKYIEKLDALTGARYHRLRKGKWVQAEGVVYDGWDRAVHVIEPFELPRDWPRYWSIDFGYTNPFVCQFWAEDPDGRLYLYREIYQTQRLVEDHAWAILEAAGAIVDGRELWLPGKADPKPQAIVCDHDAEDRATLERHLGMKTTAAPKDVSPGIQAVAARLKVAGDGKPRLFVFRDAVVRRDPALEEAKKPCCTEEEVDSYIWDKTAASQGKEERPKEEPVKVNDHGCFVAGTLILTKRGEAPIETVSVGAQVLTHLGWAQVLEAGQTGVRELVRLRLEDSRVIICTPEHPIGLTDGGWVAAEKAAGRKVDVLCGSFVTERGAGLPLKRCFGAVHGGEDIHGTLRVATATSGERKDHKASWRTSGFINRFGLPLAAPCPPARSFTTKTVTCATMSWETWNCVLPGSMPFSIPRIYAKQLRQLATGMVRQRALPGTASMDGPLGRGAGRELYNASVVVSGSVAARRARSNSVPVIAERLPGASPAWITKTEPVRFAVQPSLSTVIRRRNAARVGVRPVCVGSVERLIGVEPVYNLATAHGTYFANKVLVSNCDAMRYLVYWLDRGPGGYDVPVAGRRRAW